jgi:hypothetical protein
LVRASPTAVRAQTSSRRPTLTASSATTSRPARGRRSRPLRHPRSPLRPP